MLILKSTSFLVGFSMALLQKSAPHQDSLNFISSENIDYEDYQYFTNKNLYNNLNGRGIAEINKYSTLIGDVLGALISNFDLKVLADTHKLMLSNPPKFRKRKLGLPAASIQEVKQRLPLAMIASCPINNGTTSMCVCTESFSEVNYIVEESSSAVTTLAVHPKDKLIIVAYRPTKTLANFVSDIDYDWLDMPMCPNGAKVHKGFLEYFLSTKLGAEKVMLRLLKAYPDYNLHITGFSLGSAAATISLPYWDRLLKSKKDKRNIRAFLYSGPRVGDEAFAQHILDLNIQITRYTNRNDVVSHVPPRTYGFVHVGAEVHETYPGFMGNTPSEFKVCSLKFDEDPDCGWKDRFPVSILRHTKPMDNTGSLPLVC